MKTMQGLHILQNDKIRIALNDKGCLVELINLETRHNYASKGFLWRLIFQKNDCLENEIFAENCIPVITNINDKIVLTYHSLVVENRTLNINLTIKITLVDDEVHWNIELQNNEQELVVSECHFPTIEACNIKKDQALLWTKYGGQKFTDPRAEIAKYQTLYMAKDYNGIEMNLSYNAFSGAATNCFLFMNDDEGLYFGSHDLTFQTTLHSFRLINNEIDAGFVKYPYLKYGQSISINGFVIAPYTGQWHVASRKYRMWADLWFKQAEQPEWIKTMKGWQRIILKHQYGEIHYKYNQLDAIMNDGKTAGIDTLLLFGWHRTGMDNCYPEYQYDESQGGQTALAKNIRKCQKKGGKIILYFNGRLIDKATDFYKKDGYKISIKDIDGNEFLEHYKFGGSGTGLRLFGYKTFAVACPSSNEWFTVLKQMADQALELGADGVFFDQTGHGEIPCYDEKHGHPVPFTTITACKATLMEKLRSYIKSRNPNMAVGHEVPLDIMNQHGDFVHSHVISVSKEQGVEDSYEVKPNFIGFIEWYRYTFPEVILSDREIRDDTDIKRRLNYCLSRGLRSDVEIYRCRKTIKETPIYQNYLNKIDNLRDKYQNLLLKGNFNDKCGFKVSNRELDATSFDNGEQKAIVLTQSYFDKLSTELIVPGYSYLEHDGTGDFALARSKESIKVSLKRDAIVIVVLNR